MAGRHGVPTPDRRNHARTAAGARRRRADTRDAAQPWAAWLALRGFLALLVLAAASWSVLLLTQSRGGIWPIIALAAGALSLAMIGLDVRARRRQRSAWRAVSPISSVAGSDSAVATFDPAPPAPWTEPETLVVVDAVEQPVEEGSAPQSPPYGEIPELPRRRSHRK
jgi:hypothetical protein